MRASVVIRGRHSAWECRRLMNDAQWFVDSSDLPRSHIVANVNHIGTGDIRYLFYLSSIIQALLLLTKKNLVLPHVDDPHTAGVPRVPPCLAPAISQFVCSRHRNNLDQAKAKSCDKSCPGTVAPPSTHNSRSSSLHNRPRRRSHRPPTMVLQKSESAALPRPKLASGKM
jgi:hypothetical protein